MDAAESVLTEAKLRELAELCHLHIDDAKLPSLLKEVEAIIQCTKTIQAMTLNENIDDLYAKDDFDSGTNVFCMGWRDGVVVILVKDVGE